MTKHFDTSALDLHWERRRRFEDWFVSLAFAERINGSPEHGHASDVLGWIDLALEFGR